MSASKSSKLIAFFLFVISLAPQPLIAQELTSPKSLTIELLEEVPVDSQQKSEKETNDSTRTASPEAPISDRKERLLSLRERVGYGSKATGGSNYVTVSNFSDMKAALETENSYVILSASLQGASIGFTSQVRPAKNTTLDGSDAVGATLFPDYDSGYPANTQMFAINRGAENTGNQIFYNISLDGRRSGRYTPDHPSYNTGGFIIRTGTDYWFHKVEITSFWDDAISAGRQADYMTFSNLKIVNTDKAFLLFYPDSSSHGNGHISIVNCELSAAGRNPLNTGGEFVHVWNSYIHSWRWLANSSGYLGTSSTTRTVNARTISEHNYYEDGANGRAERGVNESYKGVKIIGWMYSIGSIFNGNEQESQSNLVNLNNVSDAPFPIPYEYSVLPAEEVKEHVLNNAGPG